MSKAGALAGAVVLLTAVGGSAYLALSSSLLMPPETTTQSVSSNVADEEQEDTRKATLPGFGKFKFGMSREQLLVAGGPDHTAVGDNAISYPVQIYNTSYTATAMLPRGYVEAILVEDGTASAANSKEDCFALAQRRAAMLDEKYGRHDHEGDQNLAGAEIRTLRYDFEDGNSISIMGLYSDACRVTVTYQGPNKGEQGQW